MDVSDAVSITFKIKRSQMGYDLKKKKKSNFSTFNKADKYGVGQT
jgi:hypothetical protein